MKVHGMAACDFCGKTDHAEIVLAAKSQACICDGCLDIGVEVVRQRRERERVERLAAAGIVDTVTVNFG